MALFKSKEILKFSLTIFVTSAMFREISTEEYSANIERQDSLKNLHDFGTISRLLRHPEHGQALRELKAVLLSEPFLGINKVSGTLSLAGLRGYDQNIHGNVYHRKRRSVAGNNETTDEAIYSTTAHSTEAHQVTEAVDNTNTGFSRRPPASTSVQPQLTTPSAQVSRCDNHTRQMFTSLINQEQWALQCKLFIFIVLGRVFYRVIFGIYNACFFNTQHTQR